MKKLFAAALLIAAFFPLISADIIEPGFHGVTINNYITNINDFQNYTFVSMGDISPQMCPIQIIESDGKIPDYYKFCSVSVYAIPKNNFNVNVISNMGNNESILSEEVISYFESVSASKVLENISTYSEVADTNPIEEEMKNYSINAGILSGASNNPVTEPDNTDKVFNNTLYIYIGVSVIAAAIIIFLIARKYSHKKR